jgi:molybdopterin converting factor subunit 1
VKVQVRLFAAYREAVGARAVDLDVAPGATVVEALKALQVRFPAVEPLERQTVFAVNEEYVSPDATLGEGDVLAFIPPVSGGG